MWELKKQVIFTQGPNGIWSSGPAQWGHSRSVLGTVLETAALLDEVTEPEVGSPGCIQLLKEKKPKKWEHLRN